MTDSHRGLAASISRAAAGAAMDALRGSRPAPGGIPGGPSAITARWLTAVLCRDIPGAEVVSADITGGSDGTSARRRLRIAYNDAGAQAGLPTAVFVKCARALTSRVMLGLTGITRGEELFYNELRPLVDLRSPRGYFARADAASGRSIVVMEDMTEHGWDFPDPMRNPVTRADAIDMVEQMARYHAAFWGGGGHDAVVAGLASTLEFQERLARGIRFRWLVERGMRAGREALPDAVWVRRDEFWPALQRARALNVAGPQTVLHQDLHAGNWLRDAGGRMGLYDWQCVVRGGWAQDLAYAFSAVLETDDRRAWERDLLRHYLEQLASRGVTDVPEEEAAWLDVRRQAPHAVAFGVATAGQPKIAGELQPRDYVLRSIDRLGTAIDDWGTLALLRP